MRFTAQRLAFRSKVLIGGPFIFISHSFFVQVYIINRKAFEFIHLIVPLVSIFYMTKCSLSYLFRLSYLFLSCV